MATTKKRSRSGSRFFRGDDLKKTREDRKRTSSTEPWEKKRKPAAKKAATKAASKRASKATAKKTRKPARKAAAKKSSGGRTTAKRSSGGRKTAARKATKKSARRSK